ncbi:MAG: lysoplasmalogenase family protein [Hylemonella sp.]|nr:lysoplasmalogenase family protein [Hylemonella sp.]
MSPSQIIVLATPVFLLLIALEVAWGIAKGRNTYRLNDALTSVGLGVLSQISAVLTPALRIGIYTVVFEHVALARHDAFWLSAGGWLLALVCYDFCYYWLHRAGHEVAVFWAAHVVHHQSQDYNLSTALRQTSSGALLGWLFYLPMALVGVPPLVFGVVALIDLLYQFWVHTEHVGKLGWFDRWFCSPSNHRVHHAVNNQYLDRNYGGILIIWDRLFGSFQEEDAPCVYGTRQPLDSWDPLWANAEVYADLLRTSWRTRRWRDKLMVWLRPPGWRPTDLPVGPAFELARVRRYDPPASRAVQALGSLQFALLLGASVLFLWHADTLPAVSAAIWLAALTAGLWSLGGLLQGRLSVLDVLFIASAALTTAGSAAGLPLLHQLCKPLPLLFALGRVIHAAPSGGARGLLLVALAASLAGDIFLMLPPGYFVAGLLSFLLAHLAYLALFRRGLPWFASRIALVLSLVYGAAVCAVLWTDLPAPLRAPVAIYVLAITLMVAQAVGRARLHPCPGATRVAVGAGLFLLSDTLLALDRYTMPLPQASFWVLATYYAAQFLIVRGVLADAARGLPSVRTPRAA